MNQFDETVDELMTESQRMSEDLVFLVVRAETLIDRAANLIHELVDGQGRDIEIDQFLQMAQWATDAMEWGRRLDNL